MALTWSGLGMNIGGYGTINAEWVTKSCRDIDELLATGFTEIRMGNTDIAFGGATGFAQQVVEYGISVGANMMWGPDQGSVTLTSANWPTYHDTCITRFNEAMARGQKYFSTGNEMEASVDGTTLTISQLFDNHITLAEELQVLKLAAESDIIITYNSTAGQSVVDLWGGKSLIFGAAGSFDMLGFQPYGNGQTDLSGFYTDCKRIWDYFGTDAIITEFNLVTDSGSLTLSQENQMRQMDIRTQMIRGIGFQQAFPYRWKDEANSGKLTIKYVDETLGYKQVYWSFVAGRQWFKNV